MLSRRHTESPPAPSGGSSCLTEGRGAALPIGRVNGRLDRPVARRGPLAPRAATVQPVPAPRTAPSTSLGHQQLGG